MLTCDMVHKILVVGGNGFIGAYTSLSFPLRLQPVCIRIRGLQSCSSTRSASSECQVRATRDLDAIVHISQCSSSGKPYQTAKGHRPDWTDNVCCQISRYCTTDHVFTARPSLPISPTTRVLFKMCYTLFGYPRP